MNTNELLNKIILGDCRKVLKNVPDNFFDCICSDVPYKIVTGGVRKSKESIDKFSKTDPSGILKRIPQNDFKRKWIKKDFDEDNAYFVGDGKLFKHCDIEFTDWLPDVYRVLKEDSHAYFMVNSRNLIKLQTKAEKAGFKFLNLLVWVKNNATPNKYYMQKCEFILFLRKGKAKNINNMGVTNVFNIRNIIGNKYHPTEKPVELMKKLLIQSTKPNDLILDMFCGSGSTCIAAKQIGVNFIGIEIDKKYFEIANKRLSENVIIQTKNDIQLTLI